MKAWQIRTFARIVPHRDVPEPRESFQPSPAKNLFHVTLTANPGGNVFTGWTGACSGTAPTCTVFVNQSTSVPAVFSK